MDEEVTFLSDLVAVFKSLAINLLGTASRVLKSLIP